jgi:hypothetical protein
MRLRNWASPVSQDIITSAKEGKWAIHLTKKPIPHSWLPQDIKEKHILCLASSGGQHAPVLALFVRLIRAFSGFQLTSCSFQQLTSIIRVDYHGFGKIWFFNENIFQATAYLIY